MRVWLTGIVLVFAVSACSGGGSSPAAAPQIAPIVPIVPSQGAALLAPATVTVDFSAPRQQVSMSGFLNGQIKNHATPTSLLAPLKPATWRGSTNNDPGDEAELHGLFPSMRYIEVLSDKFGYPFSGLWSSTGSKAPPFDQAPYGGGAAIWAGDVATEVRPLCSHPEVVYEAWNEPNVSGVASFFDGSATQAYVTQAEAYAATASACAGAVQGAPATVLYDKPFITNYLTYCVANGCQVNFISIHDTVDNNIPQVALDLEDARASFMGNPAYASLNIQKIYNDESVGIASDRVPGDILAYLYYLEVGGADGSDKACWTSPSGSAECYDGSVDGIIDPSTEAPRAAWWSYKYYADGVPTRVSSSTADPGIVALASTASATAGAAQIVLSAITIKGAAPSTSTPVIALNGLNAVRSLTGLTSVHVRTTTIAATDVTPVPALPAPTDQVVTVTNGTANVAVNIAPHTAAVLLISAQ